MTTTLPFDLPPDLHLKPIAVMPDVWEWTFRPEELPEKGFRLSQPMRDVAGRWTPGAGHDRGLPISWERGRACLRSSAATWAPVCVLLSADDQNRGCLSVDALEEDVQLSCGVVEDQSAMRWIVRIAGDPAIPRRLRLDLRLLPIEKVLRDVVGLWDEQLPPGLWDAPLSDCARTPLYSTWYAYRQAITTGAVQEEAREARRLGMGGIIVDDGWQQPPEPANDMRHTGTWSPDRMGGMATWRAHIDAIRDQGRFAYYAWMSLPFLGHADPGLSEFRKRNWILATQDSIAADVVDPRVPEVRRWIVGHCVRLVREAGLDGLKLDFLDRFESVWDGKACLENGRDHERVGPAVARLVEEIGIALNAICPNMPVEFRQRYIGPIPRRCGRLLRAMDCPSDPVENRRRIVDTRLLAGEAVVHGDMIHWHASDTPESVARQLIASLTAVPQISMRLASLCPSHRAVLSFWLAFWTEHRELLLDGDFTPRGHLNGWDHLRCRGNDRMIDILHSPLVCERQDGHPGRQFLVNATHAEGLALRLPRATASPRIRIWNCGGKECPSPPSLPPGSLFWIPVPPGGLADLVWRSPSYSSHP